MQIQKIRGKHMGFIDGLKNFGNNLVEYTNNLKSCKIYFSSYDTNELIDMLKIGVFKQQNNNYNNSDCRIAVRMVLADRGYTSSQLNSIDKTRR